MAMFVSYLVALFPGLMLLFGLAKYHEVSRNPEAGIISDFGAGIRNVEAYKLLNVKKMAVQPTSVALPPIQVETQDHYILEIENINIFRFCDYSKVMTIALKDKEYPHIIAKLRSSNYYAIVTYGPSMCFMIKFCGNDTDLELNKNWFPDIDTKFLMSQEIRAHSFQSLTDSKSMFLEVANDVFLKVLKEHGSDEGTFKLDVSEMKVHWKVTALIRYDRETTTKFNFIVAVLFFASNFASLAFGVMYPDLISTFLERWFFSLPAPAA